MRLRVTNQKPYAMEPEIESFMSSINTLKNSQMYSSLTSLKRERSESAPALILYPSLAAD